MKTQPGTDVTTLLHAWSTGDATAHKKLWSVVFSELKRLARRQMAQERPDHTLQASALVNEAYLRLVAWNNERWENRAQFFAMCARMMRQILVDHARARGCQKRPEQLARVVLSETVFVCESKNEQILALNDALERLAKIQPRKSDVVELRFFGGLSLEEIAEVLNVSRLTVIRDWNFARAWLRGVITGDLDTE